VNISHDLAEKLSALPGDGVFCINISGSDFVILRRPIFDRLTKNSRSVVIANDTPKEKPPEGG
jgi:hypothetical protein